MTDAWEVLTLFLIPIGGGIPAGVLLARSRHIDWPAMMALYLVSDILLAMLFEPVMRLVIAAGKRWQVVAQWRENVKKILSPTTAKYGTSLGPFALILIAFGVDPMTGRAAAVAAGHGFVSGWALAITGDMLYFTLLMVSTLWLNGILGDGTWTTVIIMAVMVIVPVLIRKVRERLATGKIANP